MTTRTPRTDRCTACGSDSLWSAWVDADGLALPTYTPGQVETYSTFCNDCGTEQAVKRGRKARR